MATGENAFSQLEEALDSFQVDNGRYPTTEEGLNALISSPPQFSGHWHGPYVESIPVDAWGTAFRYECIAFEPYHLRSAGPDRTFGTDDDISKMPSW